MTKKLFPLFLLLGMFAASCGNKPAKMIQKTWNMTDVQMNDPALQGEDIKAAMQGATLTISDGSYTFKNNESKTMDAGTYTMDESGKTMNMTDGNGKVDVYTIETLDKNNLKINSPERSMTFTTK